MKYFIGIFFSLIVFSCTSIQKKNAQIEAKIEPEFLRSELDYLYRKIQLHHPHLYEYSSKSFLENKLDSIKKSIQKPLSPKEFYPIVNSWVINIKQGHNGVGVVKKLRTKEELKKNKKITFPLRQFNYFIEKGKLYVLKNKSMDSTIAVGTQIQTIDGKNADSIIKILSDNLTSDGYNTSFKRHYIARSFANMYYNKFSEKDSVQFVFSEENKPLSTKLIASIHNKTYKNKTDSIRITDSIAKFKKLTKSERKKIIKEQDKKSSRRQLYDYVDAEKEYNRELKFYNDSAVAYLKIKSFGFGRGKEFYKEVFGKIDSAKSSYLILDFRNNSGGAIADIREFNTYLPYDGNTAWLGDTQVSKKFSYLRIVSNVDDFFAKMLTSPYAFFRSLFTVKKENDGYFVKYSQKKVEPKPTAFKGKIYVIINGLCFSATSVASSQLDSFGDKVTFVGEEAGGDYNGTVAGVYNRITLPKSKVKINHGIMHIQPNHRRELKGRGMFPDVKIIPTIKDIAAKKDLELDWILNDISKQKK